MKISLKIWHQDNPVCCDSPLQNWLLSYDLPREDSTATEVEYPCRSCNTSLQPPFGNSHEWPLHLFEYPYEGSYWAFEIPAPNQEEAIRRLNALYYAKYKGVVEMKIPANKATWFPVRLYCAIRNFFRKV